jgi:hypothetical protein
MSTMLIDRGGENTFDLAGELLSISFFWKIYSLQTRLQEKHEKMFSSK